MKRIMIALAVLALCAFGLALAGAESAPDIHIYQLGETMEDFAFTTCDGQSGTLSQLLAEKDMVLLNLWATWCGPCEDEFPAMEEAYEAYADRVAIVALSVEPTDTDEMLAAYAAEHGMTFLVGRDDDLLGVKLNQPGIPVSVVIDRNGVICMIEMGAVTDPAIFSAIFDLYLADGYDAPYLLEEPLTGMPSAQREDPAALAEALGTETAANPAVPFVWPMQTAEADGRTVLTPSNIAIPGQTAATVDIPLTLPEAGAVTVTAKLNVLPAYDALYLLVNGEPVKGFTGDMDWFTYAIPAEAGELTLTIRFSRTSTFETEEAVYIDSVAVLTGDEAAAALAANPVYPVSDALTIMPLGDDVREITVSDPELMEELMGTTAWYILNGDPVFAVTAGPDVDPDLDFLHDETQGTLTLLRDAVYEDVYLFATGMNTTDTTGYPYSDVFVYWNGLNDAAGVTFFPDEAHANYFFYYFVPSYGYELSWSYPDGSAPARDLIPEVILDPDTIGMSEYTVRFVDQDGLPVEGVTFLILDGNRADEFTSEAEGVVTWSGLSVACEIELVQIPEGYEGELGIVCSFPEEGGEETIVLTRK